MSKKQKTSKTQTPVNATVVLSLYDKGKHTEAYNAIAKVLDSFGDGNAPAKRLQSMEVRVLDSFVSAMLFVISRRNSATRDDKLLMLTRMCKIAEMTAASSFKTTKGHLMAALHLSDPISALTLMNPLVDSDGLPNSVDEFFKKDRAATSLWYYLYIQAYKYACVDGVAQMNLRRHIEFIPDNLGLPLALVHEAYFGCTYIAHDIDHKIKAVVNRKVEQWTQRYKFPPRLVSTNSKRVGIVTGMWRPGHSVYRCLYQYVKELTKHYELTLINTNANEQNKKMLDTKIFGDRVINIEISGDPSEVDALRDKEFDALFYPDIGMSIESVVMANMRIAPVQIAGYGHPVSTHGSKIDYWVAGRDVEKPIGTEENYTERLLFVSGAGVVPLKPLYDSSNIQHRDIETNMPIYIGCPWYAQKINYTLLATLARIKNICGSANPIIFEFFPGNSMAGGGFFLVEKIREILGPNVFIYPGLPYNEYMSALGKTHLVLDSYPFGGYATVTDALWLRKPVVTMRGTKFYNRAGGYLLERVGCPEYIANTYEEYANIVAHLVVNRPHLKAYTDHIRSVNLDQTIFSDFDAEEFASVFRSAVSAGRNWDRAGSGNNR